MRLCFNVMKRRSGIERVIAGIVASMLQPVVDPIPLSSLLRKRKRVEEPKPADAFRPITMQITEKGGTAYVQVGGTKVFCTISGPKELAEDTDTTPSEGVVKVYVNGEDLTSHDISEQETSTSASKGLVGLRHALESAVRSMICLDLFYQTQIDVMLSVIRDDGGILAASVMAASLALISAGIQVYDICVAAHVVLLQDGRIIIDPSSSMTSGIPDCISVTVGMMPSLNQMVCSEHTGLARLKQLREAVGAAAEAALKLYPIVRKAVENPVEKGHSLPGHGVSRV